MFLLNFLAMGNSRFRGLLLHIGIRLLRAGCAVWVYFTDGEVRFVEHGEFFKGGGFPLVFCGVVVDVCVHAVLYDTLCGRVVKQKKAAPGKQTNPGAARVLC